MNNTNINNLQHCHICGKPLLKDFKYSGKHFMCNKCFKTRNIIRIILFLIAIALYAGLYFLAWTTIENLQVTAIFIPSLPILIILAYCLGNPVAKLFVNRKTIPIKSHEEIVSSSIIENENIKENASEKTDDNNKTITKFKPNKKSKKIIIPVIFLSVLSTTLLGINVYQYINYSDLKKQLSITNKQLNNKNEIIDSLSKDVSSLNEDKSELEKERDKYMDSYYFFKAHAAIVYDDGTKLYHTYDCPIYEDYDGSFWIYNSEQADDLGYSPHKLCQYKVPSFLNN